MTDDGLTLASEKPLQTLATIALFTNAPVTGDEPIVLQDAERTFTAAGWWGNTAGLEGDQNKRPIGSRLWILARAPLTRAIASWAAEEAQNALQFMIDEGLVARLTIVPSWSAGEGWLQLQITAFSHDNATLFQQPYGWMWER